MIDKSRGVNGWELEVIRLALPIDANGILAMVNFLAGPQHPSQTSTDNTESLRKKSKMRHVRPILELKNINFFTRLNKNLIHFYLFLKKVVQIQ